MNWVNILLDAGLNIPIDKEEVSIVCPLHEDRVSSLSINTEKGVWICFAGCGQGSLTFFLSKYWGLPISDVENFLSDKEVELDLNFDGLEVDTDEEPIYLPEDFQMSDYPSWAINRGFTSETLQQW